MLFADFQSWLSEQLMISALVIAFCCYGIYRMMNAIPGRKKVGGGLLMRFLLGLFK